MAPWRSLPTNSAASVPLAITVNITGPVVSSCSPLLLRAADDTRAHAFGWDGLCSRGLAGLFAGNCRHLQTCKFAARDA